jgi:hypothetical protein
VLFDEDTSVPVLFDEDTSVPVLFDEDTSVPVLFDEDTSVPVLFDKDTSVPVLFDEDTIFFYPSTFLYPLQTKFWGVYRNHPVRPPVHPSMYLVSTTPPKRLIHALPLFVKV